MSEEASYPRASIFSRTPRRCTFLCHMKHFHNVLLHRSILSPYTLRTCYLTGSGLSPEPR
ncbi:TPA: hypothetical protein MFM65_005677 [Klebsiella pneumoniae]|uniref:Uncharacterized protein n=1 Tax=Enterobacter kobei TaxID=208224 RepID=A0ABX9F4X6_9ENTR|nr:hypothetical protein DP181_12660 [Enterobacter kobei]HAJ3442849.1 hypothetical protein [Escherichia coli]HBW8387684.1 hypothetical protein [Klebsiella pneumoniae]HBW8410361.1 hypothetical protein [Klebsiella pneumoniae]HBW8526696.1 hypothetical protein [Klebsiella pneumoniae]